MEERELLKLLREVQAGTAAPEEAARILSRSTFEDLGYAKVDHHRASRQGAAEVIFGQGKEPDQIEGIVRSMAERGAGNILITRLSGEKEEKLRGRFPYRYSAEARLAVANPVEIPLTGSMALGSRVHRVYDAGVAGLHRLLAHLEVLEGARCIVAVAGMEGALPSVVGGLVSCPVIAVPTSVGYGANLGGVSVVNIDNGFGGGFLAHRINQMKGIDQ